MRGSAGLEIWNSLLSNGKTGSNAHCWAFGIYGAVASRPNRVSGVNLSKFDMLQSSRCLYYLNQIELFQGAF